ncbi:MAG: DNRLRE domain-containing protein [Pontiellaceae bacterium]|jgi:hypothetical protein|nr:DNRLRE domain-containing protein [Pontiellaceae bacterium]
MKKIRSAEASKTNRLRGGLLIFAALALSANSLFAAVTDISQLDNACAFQFACFSDSRGEMDENTGRALGWIKAYDDFAIADGDLFDGNNTKDLAFQALWRTNSFWHNNCYPQFGNHCSIINGGYQPMWGRPYYTLTNLNTSGWEFRTPGTAKITGWRTMDDHTLVNYDDRKIDYYVKRTFGAFNVHLVMTYKADHCRYAAVSANWMRNKVMSLSAGKTKHDLIVVVGHEERWLTRACTTDGDFPGPMTRSQVEDVFKNSDIVIGASDHQFRRMYNVDDWGLSNPALYVDSGQVYNTASTEGYLEFHVFEASSPFVTCQYINADITTRKLHVGRANDGAISIKDGHDANSQYAMRKVIDGAITQPLNWSTLTVTGAPPSTTTVPWVTNLTVAAAGTSITNAGLVVSSVSQEYHATVPAGKIFSQTPGGGTTVNRGSSVALAESLGPASGGTTVTFVSVAAHDGYVDEASETSNTGGVINATSTDGNAIRVGDTGARKQRKGFVSFDCSSLPDTCTIISATLKLKRGGGIGTPTSLSNLVADVKNVNGGWSDNAALQSADFQGPASASGVATLSYPATTNSWAIGALNATGLTKISKTTASHTQYRIRFTLDDDNDAADDYLGFYSGENATVANRPILEVTYQ